MIHFSAGFYLHSLIDQLIPNFLLYKFNVISTNIQAGKIRAVEAHCFTMSLFKIFHNSFSEMALLVISYL